MLDDPIEQKIIDEVENHYANSQRPYYLADLGVFVKGVSGFPDDIKLKEFVETKLHGRLHLVQDPRIQARIIVATPHNFEKISETMKRDLQPGDDLDVRRLPNSLAIAFCIPPKEGQKLFYNLLPPFGYTFAESPPSALHIEIDPEFQPVEFRGRNFRALPDAQKVGIFRHIIKWADAKSIDLRTLYVRNQPDKGGAKHTARNALERLIMSQEPSLRDKIYLPMDIAKTLMDLA
jgi:hypothetical protein